jgi:hypothetical protein
MKMKKANRFEEVTLELVETTGVNIRKVMANNEEAIEALSAYAQPIRPLELVHPPKPSTTMICFEVHQAPTQEEVNASKRSTAARQLHWFDLVALFSVTALAGAKLGVLDLASLWT